MFEDVRAQTRDWEIKHEQEESIARGGCVYLNGRQFKTFGLGADAAQVIPWHRSMAGDLS